MFLNPLFVLTVSVPGAICSSTSRITVHMSFQKLCSYAFYPQSYVYTHTHMHTHTHSEKGIFSSVQLLSRVRLFGTPQTAARQASLSITNSRSPLKLTSIESVMPSSHLILCHPLLLLPSIFPSIRIFSNESVLRIRQPKYWSFSFNISPSNEHSGLISFRINITKQ